MVLRAEVLIWNTELLSKLEHEVHTASPDLSNVNKRLVLFLFFLFLHAHVTAGRAGRFAWRRLYARGSHDPRRRRINQARATCRYLIVLSCIRKS